MNNKQNFFIWIYSLFPIGELVCTMVLPFVFVAGISSLMFSVSFINKITEFESIRYRNDMDAYETEKIIKEYQRFIHQKQ